MLTEEEEEELNQRINSSSLILDLMVLNDLRMFPKWVVWIIFGFVLTVIYYSTLYMVNISFFLYSDFLKSNSLGDLFLFILFSSPCFLVPFLFTLWLYNKMIRVFWLRLNI